MNLSSSAAEIGSPMFTVYNATKVTIFQVCYMYMCTKLIIVHHMSSVRWPRRAILYSILSKLHLVDLHFINFAIW